ncbi:hypothetical protein BV898_04887 [Hypsibius exemplaris]|uniref:RING-type domain-containing protein n=1 Tax=Hypsibius exemplaris TaxID=2072580 RepID=A0A1W0X111_HYPEX|nr:hypothetical protein BV898_04887 [Hypsibius exemplaris]
MASGYVQSPVPLLGKFILLNKQFGRALVHDAMDAQVMVYKGELLEEIFDNVDGGSGHVLVTLISLDRKDIIVECDSRDLQEIGSYGVSLLRSVGDYEKRVELLNRLEDAYNFDEGAAVSVVLGYTLFPGVIRYHHGQCDGSFHGEYYFRCAPFSGAFVAIDRLYARHPGSRPRSQPDDEMDPIESLMKIEDEANQSSYLGFSPPAGSVGTQLLHSVRGQQTNPGFPPPMVPSYGPSYQRDTWPAFRNEVFFTGPPPPLQQPAGSVNLPTYSNRMVVPSYGPSYQRNTWPAFRNEVFFTGPPPLLQQPRSRSPARTVTPNKSISQSSDLTTAPSDIESITKEYERLKKERICKVCLVRDSQMIFHPCGHLVCCSQCSAEVQTCPVCRAVIAQKSRVYLA